MSRTYKPFWESDDFLEEEVAVEETTEEVDLEEETEVEEEADFGGEVSGGTITVEAEESPERHEATLDITFLDSVIAEGTEAATALAQDLADEHGELAGATANDSFVALPDENGQIAIEEAPAEEVNDVIDTDFSNLFNEDEVAGGAEEVVEEDFAAEEEADFGGEEVEEEADFGADEFEDEEEVDFEEDEFEDDEDLF